MSDHLRFTVGRADGPCTHTLDQLPHHGPYFTDDESELAKYTFLCDVCKTPKEILASFEEIFPYAKQDSVPPVDPK